MTVHWAELPTRLSKFTKPLPVKPLWLDSTAACDKLPLSAWYTIVWLEGALEAGVLDAATLDGAALEAGADEAVPLAL